MNVKSTFYFLFLAVFLCSASTLFAQERAPLDVALDFLKENRKQWYLTDADIAAHRLRDEYTTKHNGVTHLYFNQQYDGIDVRNAITTVNVLPNGRVLHVGNRFLSDLSNRIRSSEATLSAAEALTKVMGFFNIPGELPQLKEKINGHTFVFEKGGIALEPVKVDLVYEPLADKVVRLAWRVELYELSAQNWWNVRIDAQTGLILSQDNQVIHCDFGPGQDESCHEEHRHYTAFSNPKVHKHLHAAKEDKLLVPNSYNVFPIPLESPNHGGRSLMVDPSNPLASPFGWHDVDGMDDGPDYTITRGNNVHAYHDIFNRNQSAGDEPDGGDLLEFDFPLDLSTGLPYTQVEPATVNLFYWNNIMHDLWYQYGFDEASGNFQQNNYNRGGVDGDYVRAEALDGSGTNNANFATGADGNRGRMQMYAWTRDNLPTIGSPELGVVDTAGGISAQYAMVPAAFGGELPEMAIRSKVILASDDDGTVTDACDPLVNGAEISGNIAMIDRGNCQFGVKCLRAQNAGAIAVIICNNNQDNLFPMGPGTDGGQVTIPAVMVSLNDCNVMKMTLPDLEVELKAVELTIPLPGPRGFDSDFDNGIIVHEYTHGISNRLTGGPSTGGCLTNFEQAGEGWSDWFALVMQTTSDDVGEVGRGIGTYATGQPTTGGGIRPFPYSRNMSVNPHTYQDINGVSVPHGVGSVFAVIIWDLYWNMVDIYGFDDDLYNGEGGNNKTMQLVLDGLKLQACDPTFIDARDAILAADEANYEGIHRCLIWETFARRGVGVDASPGGEESFDIPQNCDLALKIQKTAEATVDAGQTLAYTITVRNDTEDTMRNVIVTDQLPDGTTYVDGSASCGGTTADNNNALTIPIGTMLVGEEVICTYEVTVAATPFSMAAIEDGAEDGPAVWDIASPVGDVFWAADNANVYAGDFSWYAQDIETESDQYLATAEPINLTGANPVLSFWHLYDTEANWDGGVVEISTDGGANWDDLGDNMVQNGYNSQLRVNPASAISGREAFNGRSGGYIQTIIDLASYSGNEILFRFRFATDGASGADGWYIDEVVLFNDFYVITNQACLTADGNEEVCTTFSTAVLGEEMSTSTNDLSNQLEVVVAPNPTKARVNLSLRALNDGPANISISGIDGRLLQTIQTDRSNGNFELDLSSLGQGLYILQVQTDGAKVIKKVVVQ
ncbi:MAG: T9SS-dependent M36 family metallopeptidase [Bacteroidota bacterium]